MKVGFSTILLVEDNQDDEKMTLRALAKSEPAPQVTVIRDGPGALDFFFGPEPGPLPALVLLDLKLPMVGGLEILQQLRENERTKGMPVVVLTSSDETPDIRRAYSLGANSYICKPVDYEKYLHVVQLLGIYWLQTNKLPQD